MNCLNPHSFVAIVILFVRVQKTAGQAANVGANTGPFLAMGLIGLSCLILLLFGVWLYLRYILANAVCTHEKTSLLQSLKRSAESGKGLRWRLPALVLVTVIIRAVSGIIFTIPVWVSLFRQALHPPTGW